MPQKGSSLFYKSKRVLMPGGAGFIGSNLSRRLVAAGANVTIVDSFEKSCGANQFNVADIESKVTIARKKMEEFVKGSNIELYDIIFNCIGLTNHHVGYENPVLDYEINCLSGLLMLEKLAAAKAHTRLISIGTRNQYGRSASSKLDEFVSMNPLDVQAIHKVALEQYHRVFASRYGLDVIFVRMTNTYGPAQRLSGDGIGVVGEIIRNALIGDDIIVYGDMERVKDLVFVEDAVDALLALGALPVSSEFDVYNGGGQAVSLGELVDAVKSKLRINVRVVPFPDKIKKLDTGDVVLDTGKLAKATGWKPKIGIGEGIVRTIDYYERHRANYL